MELKKSKKANLERFRVVLFQTGLVVSLLFAITLLSWNFKVVIPDIPPPDTAWVDIQLDPIVYEPKVKDELPKPELQKQKITDIFKQVEDAAKIEEPEKPITADPPAIDDLPKLPEISTGETDPPRVSAGKMPASPGCGHLTENLQRIKCTEEFIINKVYNYLKDKNKSKLSGKVFVYFVIDRFGKVADVKIMNGIEPSLDSEVIKAVYSLGEFEPAIQDGLPVSIKYTLPVEFKVR